MTMSNSSLLKQPDDFMKTKTADPIEQKLDEFFKTLIHTQGTWKYELDVAGSTARVYAKGNHVANIWSGRKPSMEIVEANSKLISASPDMLRTLCRTYLTLLVKFNYKNSKVIPMRIQLDGTLADLRNQICLATGLEGRLVQDTFEGYAYELVTSSTSS